jgi:hypothetical protein
MTCAIGTTTLSFVLPAAECDFSLDSAEKGEINATPLVGQCKSQYFCFSTRTSTHRQTMRKIQQLCSVRS